MKSANNYKPADFLVNQSEIPLKFLQRFNLSNAIAFFDFDNTITPFDTLDKIVESFAKDKNWQILEDAWRGGKIGSKECLEGQLKSVRVARETLVEFLASVQIDPFFKPLVAWLKNYGIESIIVSDGFEFIIQQILHFSGAEKIKVFANEIRFEGKRLIPSFPFQSKDCSRCAHCKRKHLEEHPDKTIIYIGDGLSDVCPAEKADLVFAKDTLLDYLQKSKKKCLEFTNLGDVYKLFEQSVSITSNREIPTTA